MSQSPEGTRIVLVRHGEPQSALEQRMGGHTHCLGLSERGRAQVEALRDRLAASEELGDDVVLYSSLLRRAIETASILAPAFGGAAVTAECRWCERHFADDLDGVPYEEFRARYPALAEWDPDTRRGPGDETFNEMAARVRGGFDRLAAEHPGRTVVVACHGGVVWHALIERLGLDRTQPNRGLDAPKLTGLTEFRWGPGQFDTTLSEWRLVRFNDVAHLAGRPDLADP
jgi:2,3-bisphosphoglycerate-dependent phosphoglycerate mutase